MGESTKFRGLEGRRIFVAGHRGMVGGAISRRLEREACRIIKVGREKVDLRDRARTLAFLQAERPDIVVLAAGTVGGIGANATRPVDFLMDNLAIEQSVIGSAFETGVERLLFLGSSCIYPKFAKQPIAEEELLAGPLEPTNEWYAIAKIAGLKMCQAYRSQHGVAFHSAMPTNLYGPGDNYDPASSHVPAALLRRFHEAREANAPEVVVWGSGTPRREFLFVDDLADACVFLLKAGIGADLVNVGTGEDISILDFARLIAETVGYRGRIVLDRSKPDGTPRKLLDVSRMTAMGWTARTPLREGLGRAYDDFLRGGGKRGGDQVG